MEEPTDAEIEAGAEALRKYDQAGKKLNEWSSLPKARKLGWRERAEVVLRAANGLQ